MALITSAASGNFNAGATWTGGVVPGVGDTAQASNGHTITINVNTTCDQIQNLASSGTGTFVLNAGITLTSNVLQQGSASTTVLTFSSASPSEASIVGNVTGGSQTARVGARNSGTGTLNITGNVSGGITNSWGVENTSTGTVNVTGNCAGLRNSFTGAIYITGDVSAGGTSGSLAVSGAENQSTGTLSVIGTIQSSQTAAGVAGANAQQVTILSGPFLTETVRGVAPVYCLAWRWNASPSNSTFLEVMTNDLLVKRNLVTADNVTGMPDEADVKDSIVYGPFSELTGTFEQTVSPSIEGISAGVWNYALSAITTSSTIGTLLKTNIDATISSRSTATTAGIADAVWDEVLTGATHNIATSAGRRLRALGNQIILENSAVTSTTNSITFNGLASAITGAYDPALIYIVEGTGVGQCRNILEYRGATKTAIVDRDWRVPPDDTSNYVIVANAGREHVNEGAAAGGSSNTIILNTSASTTDDAYNGQVVFIRSGIGSDQARRVVGYVGSTRTATVDRAWATTPTTESAYVMLPTGEFSQDYVSTAIRTELTPELDEIGEIHAIHGLKSGDALTVTLTSRTAGAISQTISGDGTTTTTVSRD